MFPSRPFDAAQQVELLEGQPFLIQNQSQQQILELEIKLVNPEINNEPVELFQRLYRRQFLQIQFLGDCPFEETDCGLVISLVLDRQRADERFGEQNDVLFDPLLPDEFVEDGFELFVVGGFQGGLELGCSLLDVVLVLGV